MNFSNSGLKVMIKCFHLIFNENYRSNILKNQDFNYCFNFIHSVINTTTICINTISAASYI